MFIKIYFEDKPVFLCNEIDDTIHEYMHHPDAIFIDEISTPAINSLLHEIAKPQFHAGILWNNDLEKLKRSFSRHFKMIIAAGGLVLNKNKDILLIFRRGKWDLPKGKLDKGETLEECAVREVKEETGITDIILGKKIMVTYHTYSEFGKHILKESHWFNMKTASEELIPQTEEGITEIKWVSSADLKYYTSGTFPLINDVLANA